MLAITIIGNPIVGLCLGLVGFIIFVLVQRDVVTSARFRPSRREP